MCQKPKVKKQIVANTFLVSAFLCVYVRILDANVGAIFVVLCHDFGLTT